MKPRLRRTYGGLIALLLLVVAVVAVLPVGAALIPGMLGDKLGDTLSAANPFDPKTVDRTGPAVLQELTQRSELKAASGYYEVVVVLDRSNDLPDFISGNRVIYIGKGDVEATVDLGGLDERRVVVSEDGTAVTVNLPAPEIGKPRLDLETSEVVLSDKGFITRFTGSDVERQAQLKAVEKLTAAANANNKLADSAKVGTRATLISLLGGLGYTDISITFDESPAKGA